MLIFLGLAAAVLGESCQKYFCATKDIELAPNQCIGYTPEAVYLQACQEGWVCPVLTSNSSCEAGSVKIAKEPLYPGEKCEEGKECLDGHCLHFACKGRGLGESCETNAHCMPGLYCSDLKCDLQKLPGELCTDSAECVNNAGCNQAARGKLGACVQYFSVQTTKKVNSCTNNTNHLCEGLNCAEIDGEFYCGGPGESYAPTPVRCLDDSQCFSKLDPFIHAGYSTTCACSYGMAGNGYCKTFPGDPIGSYTLQMLKTWVGSGYIEKCNTDRRFNSHCYSSYLDEETALKLDLYLLWTEMYSLVQDNSQCAKAIFTGKYWDAKTAFTEYRPKEEEDWAGEMIISLVFLFLF